MPSQAFSWLHLTDFHFGLNGQKSLWSNLRQPFFDDLEVLHAKTGPWQAVLFTGDLVQKGTPDEFLGMQQKVLDQLWEKLAELGSGDAVLLAVPGNHDLCRPNPNEDNPAIKTLLDKDGFNRIAGEFWNNPSGAYYRVINDAFAAYSEWWNNTSYRPKNTAVGILPGDFACTIKRGDKNIGIVGLNTAFLQLQDGDYKGKLVWNTHQLQAVCDGATDDWLKCHDVCLLLTHQGPDWLTPEARKHGSSEITPAGRFALHLFGHMHEANIESTRKIGNSKTTWLCQGSSVFGMELYGEPPKEVRSHGYSAGRIDFDQGQASFRLWPRIATDKPDGWRYIPEHKNVHLQDDQGTAPEVINGHALKTTIATQKPMSSTGLPSGSLGTSAITSTTAATNHTVSDQVRAEVRAEIQKLIAKPVMDTIKEAYLKTQIDDKHLIEPEMLLVPFDVGPFPITSIIDDWHTAVRDGLKNMEEQRFNHLPQAVKAAKEIFEWLLRLAVPDAWVSSKALENPYSSLKPERNFTENYPIWAELGNGCLAGIRPFLELAEDNFKVFSPNQVSHKDLELGLTHEDALTEILKIIWNTIQRSTSQPTDQNWQAQLPSILSRRHKDGERYHITIPYSKFAAISGNKVWIELDNLLKHLEVFVCSTDKGEPMLIVPEDELLAAIREFLLLLRKYQ